MRQKCLGGAEILTPTLHKLVGRVKSPFLPSADAYDGKY